MLKKFVSSILIIVILYISLPLETVSTAIVENVAKIVASAEAKVGVTTIDLTGIAAGTDAGHNHIYERKYDSTNHWEECVICNKKINVVNHNYTTTGTYSCSESSGYQYNVCSCGYSYRLPKKEHTLDDIYRPYEDSLTHYQNCTECGQNISKGECKTALEQRIGCGGVEGTCV